jgi:hypothetical protein
MENPMSEVNRKILKAAQEHFFRAMQVGYVAGAKGVEVPGTPKYKQIEYKSGDFRIVDQYGSSQAGKSEGTTRIRFCDDPVWVMSYGGFYRKNEIPFLKRALMQNYEKRHFTGGRGPSLMTDLELMLEGDSPVYVNWFTGDFMRFSGREEIRTCDSDSPLGWHDYMGMALI